MRARKDAVQRIKKVVSDATLHINRQLTKASSMHEAFASVLLMPGQKLSIPRLTVVAERAMLGDLKKLEIRSAEQRSVIFKKSVQVQFLCRTQNTRQTPELGLSVSSTAGTKDACMPL
jgi:hypothetical protein